MLIIVIYCINSIELILNDLQNLYVVDHYLNGSKTLISFFAEQLQCYILWNDESPLIIPIILSSQISDYIPISKVDVQWKLL